MACPAAVPPARIDTLRANRFEGSSFFMLFCKLFLYREISMVFLKHGSVFVPRFFGDYALSGIFCQAAAQHLYPARSGAVFFWLYKKRLR